jgi:uncharacterized membrane protein YeaQ/YmgE (transglycosylase-associated protein family)
MSSVESRKYRSPLFINVDNIVIYQYKLLIYYNFVRTGGTMEQWLPLIIQLVSGALGGNLAGALMKKFSLGTLGDSIVGILGGGIGGFLLKLLGVALSGGAGLDLGSIIGNIAAGGVGGGVLMAIVGLIKKALAK